ncbi:MULTISPECIES: Pls/PosA family non-ribosomal peptide synthetase [unclassified Agrococcus]|uniref:Pls/PosA family non-ribosomal peptide synthetase n=1 Tax=unclassified Agrococcus TaxID=2615065 RepID=UPI003622066D
MGSVTSPSIPDAFLASHRAAPERTLADVVAATATEHPHALALDNGSEQLTYGELVDAAQAFADRLAEAGVGRGDRVGIRISSGTTDLYVAILGTLLGGAAYVPVDADDPDERAATVFGEAAVQAIAATGLEVVRTEHARGDGARAVEPPTPDDDAWIIFTSGSTGTPKGVAVTHRSAAAFVDAESRLFLQHAPIGPADRVMAGLSVAFDASCEEMWLAWAHGACLVPAPRSLVRSGVDVAPWLVANGITIVSTVPTLVSLWPVASLDAVRMVILGGEAVPPELGQRLQRPGREVWNTYGPTEATVVACAALLDGTDPVRIGLPLDGWDLAVVGPDGEPVAEGETGELVIGGVGLARYLDPAKDAERYAPMPSLGWQRAYRSGDVVRNDPAGLVFGGRADDQIKLGGRRIELGEIDGQLLRVPGVVGAAAAVRGTAAGSQVLVGYLTVDETYDGAVAMTLLRERMPAALVPRLAIVDDLPTRTSGKVDRDALPWPLPSSSTAHHGWSETQTWLAGIWRDVLAADPEALDADFFDLGGGSLTAAQAVGRIRERHPEVVVGDLYQHPSVGALAGHLDALGGSQSRSNDEAEPIRRRTQVAQAIAAYPLHLLAGARWIAWLLLASALLHPVVGWLPSPPIVLVVVTTALLVAPPGRMLLAASIIRIVLRGVRPGAHPRGGRAHLRIWLAEQVQQQLAATSIAGAALMPWYARLLGSSIGRDVQLHALPPVTGFLRLARGASVESEVDLSGTWIDGDVVHVGAVRIGRDARIGARSTLGPGARVAAGAEVAPGSFVGGRVRPGALVSGSPAQRVGDARGAWEGRHAPGPRRWAAIYALAGVLVAALPWIAAAAGTLVAAPALVAADTVGEAVVAALPWLPLGALVGYAALMLLVLAIVRLAALAVRTGPVPVRSGAGLAAWLTVRVLDDARAWLYPLYAGALTSVWLRMLGARVGRGVEASTVVMIPSLTEIGDEVFLADDTLVGGYELTGGWLRAERVKVGKRAFLGNSGMAAPGRRIPKASLVAVLSAAPRRGTAKAGSSWIGSPPTQLRRTADSVDASRTYAPPTRLKVLRGLVETGRVVPMLLAVALPVAGVAALVALLGDDLSWGGLVATALLAPLLLMALGVVAALVAVAAKWLLVGRIREGEHPLWSGFVWRNELADAYLELLAARWFAGPASGTAAMVVWLRMLGVRVGRGVWCDSYWLPEADLVVLGDGATVNAGCVVQTHLFHDRVLSLGTVTLEAGATLGPNSVILPAATLGRHATVGPASLVMRGELVPSRTRWLGNPIGPWDD